MQKKAKRIKPRAVCRHEAREGIERAVIRGEPVRMSVGRFTVSPLSVERHKKNHLAGEMASVLKEQSGQRMSLSDGRVAPAAERDGRAGRRGARAEEAGSAAEGALRSGAT
ncbi:MAG: hypothetical protein ACKV22_33450 [Bryobacteraceae bacterium]